VKGTENKLLGIPWSKTLDTILVIFPELIKKATKTKVIVKLATIYNNLGLSELITLEENSLQRSM